MKRIRGLRDLSDDHHTALVLARACKRVSRPGSEACGVVWGAAIDAFRNQLEPHFSIEDQHLLPALEEIGEPELAGQIRADHADLRTRIEAREPTAETVEAFGERLEKHVRFEERQVFEKTQHRLPARAVEAIAEACLALLRARQAPDRTRSEVPGGSGAGETS